MYPILNFLNDQHMFFNLISMFSLFLQHIFGWPPPQLGLSVGMIDKSCGQWTDKSN
jgi:hypothetical protein